MDKTLQAAIGGDTTAAAEMWRRIAASQADDTEALAWARHVAARVTSEVINADIDSSNRRAEAALKAIGFCGRIDKNRQLRTDLEHIKGLPRSETVEVLRLVGYFDDVPTQAAAKKVDRLRDK